MQADLRGALLGESATMDQLRIVVPRVAATDAGVLIVGEPGTGREHLARLIHELGPRAAGPFASVGCPGYPWSDEFDELFGGQGRPGLLETCAEGSVYLASIDELPGAIQGKLARFVEDASYGSARSPRMMASARRNLRRMVSQGSFRRDLYYRLSVVTLRLPPLRERQQDIPLLAWHFLNISAKTVGKQFSGISDAALDALVNHRWNGNLVELASAMERAAIVEQSNVLTVESLPPSVAQNARLAATG